MILMMITNQIWSALEGGSDLDKKPNVAAIMNNMHGKKIRTLSKMSILRESSDNGGKLQKCLMRQVMPRNSWKSSKESHVMFVLK